MYCSSFNVSNAPNMFEHISLILMAYVTSIPPICITYSHTNTKNGHKILQATAISGFIEHALYFTRFFFVAIKFQIPVPSAEANASRTPNLLYDYLKSSEPAAMAALPWVPR